MVPHVARLILAAFLLLATVVGHAATQAQSDPDAVFNVQSKIYHQPSCNSARRCTKNCIPLKLSEAKKRGGRACEVCGGPSSGDDDHDARPMTIAVVDSAR